MGEAGAGLSYPDSADDEALPEPHMMLIELAWGLIANAGWDAQTGQVDLAKTEGWHDAAIRWRDLYHGFMNAHQSPGGYQTWEQLAVSAVRERDKLHFELVGLRQSLRDLAASSPVAIAEEDTARSGAS